jgi:hypothetical protein
LVDNSKNHALLQTKLKELGHPQVQVKFVKASAPGNRVPSQAAERPAPQPAASIPAVPSAPPAAPTPPAAAKAAPAPEPPKPRAEPVSAGKSDFKNDPLIQKALEVFKGQIVEVRS